MNWGRISVGGEALTLINTDQVIPQEVIDELKSHPNVLDARPIHI